MNIADTKSRTLPKPIAGRLAELRWRLTRWILVDGAGRWVWWLLAIAAADLAVDRVFKMDFAQRAIVLVLMLGCAVGLFAWRVIRPLMRRISDDALLLEVERKHPQFRQGLISGAQLARQAEWESRGVSQELVESTIRQSVSLAEAHDFTSTIDLAGHVRNRLRLIGGLLVCGILAAGICCTDFFGTWFNRNVLLGSHQWPQRTYLQFVGLQDGVLVVPRGADHDLLVHVSEKSRDWNVDVKLQIESPTGLVVYEMKPTGKLDGREHQFVLHNVGSEVQLVAMGGDDVTAPVSVKLVEPPSILRLELRGVLPSYTQLPDQLLDGPGPHSLLTGSRIEGMAVVNKPLRSFSITGGDGEHPAVAGDQPLEYQLRLPAGETELAGGAYEIHLMDESGMAAVRPSRFTVNLHDDGPPKVLASLLGISGLAVPRARIPVSYNVQDDYGVNQLSFVGHWSVDDDVEIVQDGPPVQSSRTFAISGSAEPNDKRQRQDVSVLDLEPLQLVPGTSFRLLVRAADNRPIAPNNGDSAEFLIRIVSEDELRADLLRREIEQRKAFQRTYDAQLEVHGELEAVAAMQRSQMAEREFNTDRLERLISLTRDQKLIGTNLDAIANRFEEFLVEAQNNRLDEEESQIVGARTLVDRFENQILGPIRELDRDLISLASRGLDLCRQKFDNQAELDAAVRQTSVWHQQILEAMKRIMSAMEDSENFQEVVNRLLEIKRGEDQIQSEIKRRQAEEGNTILDEDIFDDE